MSSIEAKMANAVFKATQTGLSFRVYDEADIDSFPQNVNDVYGIFTWSPNIVERRSIGNDCKHRYMGMVMISVLAPASVATTTRMMEFGGQVVALFPESKKMVDGDVVVSVRSKGIAQHPYRDDAWYRVPVTIQWECIA